LERKTCAGGEVVEYVTPSLWPIEVRMHDREVFDLAHVSQTLQPLCVVKRELFASPLDCFCGFRIKSVERHVGGAIFVVIAFDAGGVHRPNNVEARFWVGVVTDKIAEEGVMGAMLFL